VLDNFSGSNLGEKRIFAKKALNFYFSFFYASRFLDYTASFPAFPDFASTLLGNLTLKG